MKKKFSEVIKDYEKRQKRNIKIGLVINGLVIIGVTTLLVVIPKE